MMVCLLLQEVHAENWDVIFHNIIRRTKWSSVSMKVAMSIFKSFMILMTWWTHLWWMFDFVTTIYTASISKAMLKVFNGLKPPPPPPPPPTHTHTHTQEYESTFSRNSKEIVFSNRYLNAKIRMPFSMFSRYQKYVKNENKLEKKCFGFRFYFSPT